MLQKVVQDVARKQKPHASKQKPTRITNKEYDQAFEELASLIFKEYTKKKQADRSSQFDKPALTS